MEDLRDATVELFEIFIFSKKNSTFIQETSSFQRLWCHNAKVRATRAVLLSDLLERTMLTIL